MNKNQYKVIFNKNRGQMMAVAENATNHCHSAADAKNTIGVASEDNKQKISSATRIRLLAFLVMLATGTAGFVHAEGIQADNSLPETQQPIVHQSANGIPQVDIQTPSQEGVSMNQYDQFNVDKKGVILNNSRIDVQTQIGGWVQNNPLIRGEEAKIIVNQVNGENPSHLNGYIEVAGRRAEVIIANPVGINVNNGGFINASGVTLTTGKPIINNGALEGFHVRTGQISINGQGLDTSHSDFTRILTHAAKINGDIWANDLKIVAGKNDIDVNGHHTVVEDNADDMIMRAAIDTSQLGGMYAGKITLVSSEKGMGVNHSGQVYAGAGGVTIDVNGQLMNSNSIVASDDKQEVEKNASVHIVAEKLINYGKISGQDNTTIHTVNLNNSGTIASVHSLNIENQNAVDNYGKIAADVNVDMTAQSFFNLGSLTAGQDISLQIKSDFNIEKDIHAGHDLHLSSEGKITNSHALQAGSSVQIDANRIENKANAIIQANESTQLNAKDIHNRGLINSNAQTVIRTENQLNNLGTGKIYGNHVAIAATSLLNQEESIDNNTVSGTIAARERLDIGATDIQNREHAVLSSENEFVVGGGLDAEGHAVGSAITLDNASAKILSNGDMTVNVETFTNRNLHFQSSLKEVDGSRQNFIAYSPDGGHWTDSSHLTGIGKDQAIYLDGHEYEDYTQFDYVQYERKESVDESDPALVQSKGKMALNGTSLTNDKSQIMANGILFAQNDIQNIDAEGSLVVIQAGTSQHHYIGWNTLGTKHKSKWNSANPYNPADQVTSVKLNVMGYETEHTSAVETVKEEVRTVVPNIDLPDQSIFGINKKNHHQPVIETDPAFVNYREWINSDYMMKALGHTPDSMLQRLGDGYYEQLLINEQIRLLTGKVHLDGYLSNEEQYKALMDAAVVAAKKLNLKPGVALSKEQVAHLTSNIVWLVKQDIKLPDGGVVEALVPQVYVVARHDAANGNGSIIAADQLTMNARGNINNNAAIVGHHSMDITANNVNNIGGKLQGAQIKVDTVRDINNVGGLLIAENGLTLNAGNNLNSASTTIKTENKIGQSHFTAEKIGHAAGIYVTGNDGTLTMNAGKNLHLTATDVHSAGSATLQAQQGVLLGTVKTARHDHSYGDDDNQIMHSSSVDVGSQIQAKGDILIQSGDSTNIRGAKISSHHGSVNISAGKNIAIEEGRAIQRDLLATYEINNNSFKRSETLTQMDSHSDTAISADITADNVSLKAGQDIEVKGSNVVSDHSTVLMADHDIVIGTAAEHYFSDGQGVKKQSGLMGNGTVGLSLGYEKDGQHSADTSVVQAGSVVGSINGNTTIIAKEKYQQTGSTVSSPQGDVTVKAQQVSIQAAENGYAKDYLHTNEKKEIAIKAQISVIPSVLNAVSSLKRAKEVKDKRIQKLGWANSAYGAYEVGKSIYDLTQVFNPTAKVSVTYAEKKSQEHYEVHSTKAAVSHINAGKGAYIVAVGAADQSNIDVVGSSVSGKGGTSLIADNAINIVAAQQTKSERSDNSSVGKEIGVAVNFDGSGGATYGLTVGINGSVGHSNQYDVTYQNAQVGHVDSQTIIHSKSATHIQGAKVVGRGIDITASELNVQSLQDTSVYNSKQKNASVDATIGIGTGFSGSVSYGQSKIKADYASVTEQSGIMAGDDGYQINVAGNTDLQGAIITSTQNAEDTGKNSIKTGSLTYSGIQNHADHSGVGFGISAGGDVNGGWDGKTVDKNNKSTHSLTSSTGFGFDKEHDDSVTYSGINTSNITITDDVKQQQLTGKTAGQTIVDIHTGVTTDNYKDQAGYLGNNFDKDKVQEELDVQVAVTQEFSKNVQSVKKEINAKIDDLKDDLEKNRISQSDYDEKVENLQYLSLCLSTVAAGLTAPTSSVGGIIAATVSPSVAYAIGQQFKEEHTEGSANHILAHAVLGAAVAAAGGNNALTASIAAGGAEAISPVVANWLYGTQQSDELTSDQKAVISTIIRLAGSGVGAVTGNTNNIVASGQLSENAVDNNYLTKRQAQDFYNLQSISPLKEYQELSKKQDTELAQACAANPNSEACVRGAKDALEYTGGVDWSIENARDKLKDQFASSKNVLNTLLNNPDGQNLTAKVASTIDDRANLFGAQNSYYQALGIPVKWFGSAEEDGQV